VTARPAAPLSLRREAVFVLAIAILLLAVLSVITLATHRSALDSLAEERLTRWQREVTTLARRVDAGTPPAELTAPTTGLARLERSRLDFAVDDSRGRDLLVPSEDSSVRVSARLADGEFLIATFDGGSLSREMRRVRVLTPIVVGAATAAALILLLYARRLLLPYDRLLQSARAAGYESSADEIGFLVATFEKAVAEAAQARRDEGVSADLRALESAIGSTMPSAALLLSADHRVLSANPAARELLAPGPIELDRPLDQSGLPPALRAALVELGCALDAAAGAPTARGPVEVQLADERRLEVDLRPLRSGPTDGQPARLLLIADVTAARQVAERERVDESLRRVGEVAAGLAHELRNGLATIQGYASLMTRRSAGGDLEDLKALSREATHLERVVSDFLLFARPGHARSERFDLRELLGRAAEDPALGAPVRLSSGEPLFLQADRLLIDRAVRNLLRNAAEAERSTTNSAPRAIEVSVDRTEEGWSLSIRDHGPGWPEALRSRLGEAFVSQRPGGVGLGLALAQRVARLHGGDLRFVDPEGGGAEVRLLLPSALGLGQVDTKGIVSD
jgi:signal transduction histidine kinase